MPKACPCMYKKSTTQGRRHMQGTKKTYLCVFIHTLMYVEQNEEKRKGIRLITYGLSRVIV